MDKRLGLLYAVIFPGIVPFVYISLFTEPLIACELKMHVEVSICYEFMM